MTGGQFGALLLVAMVSAGLIAAAIEAFAAIVWLIPVILTALVCGHFIGNGILKRMDRDA